MPFEHETKTLHIPTHTPEPSILSQSQRPQSYVCVHLLSVCVCVNFTHHPKCHRVKMMISLLYNSFVDDAISSQWLLESMCCCQITFMFSNWVRWYVKLPLKSLCDMRWNVAATVAAAVASAAPDEHWNVFGTNICYDRPSIICEPINTQEDNIVCDIMW